MNASREVSLLILAGAWSSACAAESVDVAVSAQASAAESKEFSSGFVRARGTELELDGRPFPFVGTNFYQGSLADYGTEEQVYGAFRAFAERGLDVVRLWAFSCKMGIPGKEDVGTPMIADVTGDKVTYDERGMRRLDVALDAARVSGVKVILTMMNYESDYCGIAWWVKKVTGQEDKNLFFSSDQVRRSYKKHVQSLLERTNARYKETMGRDVFYRDDPTILAVETLNEPHTQDFYEKNQGKNPGDVVHGWLSDVTAFIRSQDKNHLIATGEEGYGAKGINDPLSTWLDNGSKGADFERNTALPDVSMATVHFYPAHWRFRTGDMPRLREKFLKDRAEVAHRLGKPIVLEEVGFRDDAQANGEERALGFSGAVDKHLKGTLVYARKAGYVGSLVWQAVPPGFSAQGFGFDIHTGTFGVVEREARCQRSRRQSSGKDCDDGE